MDGFDDAQKAHIEPIKPKVKDVKAKDVLGYWTRLEHQYAGMAMQSILQTMPRVSDPDKYMKAAIDLSVKIANTLVNKLKEERK